MSYQLPITSQLIDYVVGIDPDADKSGLAIWCKKSKAFVALRAVSFAELALQISEFVPGTAIFYVEAGWLNKSIWHGEPPGADKWPMRSRLANAAETGRRVGENHGVGKTIVRYLEENGHEVRLEKPVSQKWDSATFNRITGYKGRTNPETRDAGKIAFKYQ